MSSLTISLVQADLVWENPEANRQKIANLLNQLPQDTQIVVLPEMFTTGFSMQPAPLAETMQGPTLRWMQAQSQQLGAVITGSVIVQADGKYYNRLLWVAPDGDVQYYDKRHLFTLAGEHEQYTGGHQQLLIEYLDWRIRPQICYDLRFPVWSRNDNDYDLLLYVANFPDKRSLAWRTLLRARAIENQAYTIGLNRVGLDGNGIYYAGDSCLIDYSGVIQEHLPARETVRTFRIEKASQQAFRKRFAFLPDRDDFTITIE